MSSSKYTYIELMISREFCPYQCPIDNMSLPISYFMSSNNLYKEKGKLTIN